MHRRSFLKNMVSGLAGPVVLRSQPRSPSSPPSIVVVLADDLGWGDLGCYGARKIPTPHADRLAAEGMRFSDAHSASAVCTPTRYGLLTGRYCWRTRLQSGVLYGYSEPLIEPGRLTVASLLRQHGYRTACVGKWHLGLAWARKNPQGQAEEDNIDFAQPIDEGPRSAGFDYFYGISASLDMPPYIYIENDRTIGRPTAHMPKQGAVRAGLREPRFELVSVLPHLTAKAVDFIERHAASARRQPFFLYFAQTSPHTPVAPSPEFAGRSQAGEYGDFVHQTDWSLGEIMKALERNKLADNTLVIFTSDNGSTMQPMSEYGHRPNGPWRGRKASIWEGGHRVPFIARWPARIKPGTQCGECICLNDLLATCAALLGAKLPAAAGEDSFSILPALTGQTFKKPLRPALVHHSIDGTFAIREGPWKLILGRGSGGWDGAGSPSDPPGQLYHLEKDPGETGNLYAHRPELVQRLTALLETFKKSGRSRPV